VDRRRFLTLGLAAGAATALPGGWAWADPRALRIGVDTCPYCSMAVIDGRFAAQAVLSGGRTLTYDAIECLLDHLAGHGPPPPDAAEAWLADRVASGREAVTWLNAEAALLLHHPRLRTPMGGGLAAFASTADARAFAETNRLDGAETLSWDEARTVSEPWVPPY
jgi:copper chaperone NosL